MRVREAQSMRTKHPIRVAYFTPEFKASQDHVFRSQVIGQATALQLHGFECMIIAADLDECGCHQVQTMSSLQKLRVCMFSDYPRRPSALSLLKLAQVVARKALPKLKDWRPDAIYVRAFNCFRPALKLARSVGARLIYDGRGLVAEEAAYKKGRRLLLNRYIAYRELECYRRADRLLCVSGPFKQWIAEHTSRSDVHVVPSCIDANEFTYRPEARRRIRRNLGWSEEAPVIVYCGSLSPWQCIGKVLSLMAQMKAIEENLKCLLLTTDPEQMQSLAIAAGLPGDSFHSLKAIRESIPDWLSAADVGVIIRQRSLVNKVASPIKIAEYLGCGLGVICSEGLGDLSDQIRTSQVGVVLRDDECAKAATAVEWLKRVCNDRQLRDRAQKLVADYLVWSIHITTYRTVYCR